MFNGKTAIATALSTDGSLLALIPKIRMADGFQSPTATQVYPYLDYYELANIEALRADDDEIESEVTFRVDLWGTASLSTIAGHVNRIMQALGYTRNYSMDQDEKLDSGKLVLHKVMSFTGTFTA
jgi:hypothetical protein